IAWIPALLLSDHGCIVQVLDTLSYLSVEHSTAQHSTTHHRTCLAPLGNHDPSTESMSLAPYSILLAALAGLHPVQGGSAAWQPQLGHSTKRDVVSQADPSGHAVKDALVRRHLAVKRYLTIDPNLCDLKPWPDKTTKYCYESTAANMWKTAGLAAGVYKCSEVADPGTACTGHQDRAKLLVPVPGVEYTPGYATVGIEPLNANDECKGPEMYINWDLREVEGGTGFLSTVAHEMGHVWGLYHEHQNPLFWQMPYSSSDGKFYLTEIPKRGATNEHVDWNSLMIYQGNDFLRKNDGPSQDGVAGIRRIYEDSFSAHDFSTLANSMKSNWYIRFKDMMRRTYCRIVE
ncbi:hypothetical protein PpBr36_00268, partial [Pyricularia pennisetigena]|uniref:hypothetical protein n=1 Tax=Pyricularia pennisetigena TaxID=1578925 RepID=UPI001152858A